MKELIRKYRDVIPYLFFGVCTTIVNVIVYWLCTHMLSMGTMPGTVAAWFMAVAFAYVTNRKWVFRSEAKTYKDIAKEMASFFSCRIMTGMVDWACMFVFVELLAWNDVFIKLAANFIVMVLNYAASKLIIFKKR